MKSSASETGLKFLDRSLFPEEKSYIKVKRRYMTIFTILKHLTHEFWTSHPSKNIILQKILENMNLFQI